jgi:hypothetical protein
MLQDMNNPVKDDNVIDITDRLDDGKEWFLFRQPKC